MELILSEAVNIQGWIVYSVLQLADSRVGTVSGVPVDLEQTVQVFVLEWAEVGL